MGSLAQLGQKLHLRVAEPVELITASSANKGTTF
jgi:hypothetical protein